jgi:hypothetical protein
MRNEGRLAGAPTRPAYRPMIAATAVFCALGVVLSSCGNSQVQDYREDPHAYLKELVHCENNYAALKDTPQCRAAMQINEDMFPSWRP